MKATFCTHPVLRAIAARIMYFHNSQVSQLRYSPASYSAPLDFNSRQHNSLISLKLNILCYVNNVQISRIGLHI